MDEKQEPRIDQKTNEMTILNKDIHQDQIFYYVLHPTLNNQYKPMKKLKTKFLQKQSKVSHKIIG